MSIIKDINKILVNNIFIQESKTSIPDRHSRQRSIQTVTQENRMSIKELFDACRKGHASTVRSIVDKGAMDINAKAPGRNSTPLHIAMHTNNVSIVSILLSSADINLGVVATWSGMTPLHRACISGSAAVISIFGNDRRCTTNIINRKDDQGDSALMAAVCKGKLECVKEMASLEAADFGTKNVEGETLMEVAKRLNHLLIVKFLEERDSAEVAVNVATKKLDSMGLREIADELDSIEAIEIVMVLEEEIMEERHKKEMTSLKEEQKEEVEKLTRKQNKEKEENQNIQSANKNKRDYIEKKIQSQLFQTPPSPNIPECPVCLDKLEPPTRIFTCPNGHLICGDCKTQVDICTNCRESYMGRATAVEQMLRGMFNVQ
eukprot:GFUD01001928.1.p1 GENE.GFUD01001928.1~~GFUD01001928.1.p1  ORF type:complete len:376 (-),score=96.30 GFUD01001928.1:148-1275(-)